MSNEVFELNTPATAEHDMLIDEDGGLVESSNLLQDSSEEDIEEEHGEEDNESDGASSTDADSEDPQEQRRIERRAERKRRAQARRAREEGTAQLLAQLKQQNDHLATQLAAVQRNSVTSQLAQVDARINDLSLQEQALLEQHAQAVTMADGIAASSAMDGLAQTRATRQALEAAKANAVRAMQQQNTRRPAPQQMQQPEELPPIVQRRAQAFMAKVPWYDINGGDEKSAMVIALDASVTKDGFDPATKAYWDELEARVNKYLPSANGRSYNREENSGSARSPVVGSVRSGKTADGKQVFRISAERVQAMKDAGMWEDPVKRKKMFARYQEADKKGGAA
jgi:hypothetical protein